ncbi:MAG: hypothetical protein LKF88_01685 [Microbacteriaceae bacterium]|nr:hypothetical protein [Microbacteriaceae bacterium]
MLSHDRLGTPTGEAGSGTAEEITILVDAGKPVAVLVNSTPRPLLSGAVLNERLRLDAYLDELRESAPALGYGNDGLLSGTSTTSPAERQPTGG